MYLLGGFEGMLIRGKMLVNGAVLAYFDTTFPSENSRNLHFLHKNNATVAKPLLGSLGKE